MPKLMIKEPVMMKGLGCFKFSPVGFCIVTLCHGKEEGRDFYAFIAIEPQNFRYFKKRYRPGEMSSFKTFGYELVRGWGTEPDLSVITHLSSRYGIEFSISENFINQMIENMEPIASPLGREYVTPIQVGMQA